MRERGFTLLEMLVVLAVLGLMVGLVIARGPLHSAGLDARTASATLAGVLRAARSQAIAADRPVTVSFDGAAGAVQIDGGAPRRLGATLAAPSRPIVFLPDGSSAGGKVGVASGSIRQTVSVDWLTGRVAISNGP